MNLMTSQVHCYALGISYRNKTDKNNDLASFQFLAVRNCVVRQMCCYTWPACFVQMGQGRYIFYIHWLCIVHYMYIMIFITQPKTSNVLMISNSYHAFSFFQKTRKFNEKKHISLCKGYLKVLSLNHEDDPDIFKETIKIFITDFLPSAHSSPPQNSFMLMAFWVIDHLSSIHKRHLLWLFFLNGWLNDTQEVLWNHSIVIIVQPFLQDTSIFISPYVLQTSSVSLESKGHKSNFSNSTAELSY